MIKNNTARTDLTNKDERILIACRGHPNDTIEHTKMGKRGSTKEKEGDTRILYRKSNHTILQSRTCSSISEFYAQTGVIQMKKKLSEAKYTDRNILDKEDLSMETDICVLRRYIKKKKDKLTSRSSGKSKYSNYVDTAIGTKDELKTFNTPCGDIGEDFTTNTNNNIQLDTTKTMVDNLKVLLNKWFLIHLLEKQEAKILSNSVLFALIQSTEKLNSITSSSSSTCLLKRFKAGQEVKNKKNPTLSHYCKTNPLIRKSVRKTIYKHFKCHSLPSANKNFRIISTLSIPRNHYEKAECRMQNIKDKTVKSTNKRQMSLMVTINKSSKFINISSFDMITIATKPSRKQIKNQNVANRKKKSKKKHHIKFLSKSSDKNQYYKISEDYIDKIFVNKNKDVGNNFSAVPSLVKSILTDEPTNIRVANNQSSSMIDHFTSTNFNTNFKENSSSKHNQFQLQNNIHIKTSDFKQSSLNKQPDIDQNNTNKTTEIIKEDCYDTLNEKSNHSENYFTTKSISKHKCYSPRHIHKVCKSYRSCNRIFSTPSLNKKQTENKTLVDHCHNIFKYLAEYEHSKDVKFDIELKLIPQRDHIKKEDKSTVTSNRNLNVLSFAKSSSTVDNFLPTPIDSCNKISDSTEYLQTSTKLSSDNQHFLTLLDSAESQAKYIIENNSSSDKSNNLNIVDQSTITNDGIIKDINELKTIIKDLTKTAEAFIKVQFKKESLRSIGTCKTIDTFQYISQSIQVTSEIPKPPLLSGIKLTKEPKKNSDSEFCLKHKSISYNIIDSESIIKVTDMTFAEGSSKQTANVVETSRSQMEVSSDKSKNYHAYYCDDADSPYGFKYKMLSKESMTIPSRSANQRTVDNNKILTDASIYMRHYPDTKKVYSLGASINEDQTKYDQSTKSYKDSVPVSKDIERGNNNERTGVKPFRQKGLRKGMRVTEGLVYCLLLWIPVIILLLLFSRYVIKDFVRADIRLVTSEQLKAKINNNESEPELSIKLSDLGF